MSLLLEEYKILQEKIDKIGAFRFTIKGWAVTATVGAFVAIATGKGFSPLASSIAIDILLLFFFWFEREQVQIGWAFNNRVRQIEVQFDKQLRAKSVKPNFPTPSIARSRLGFRKKTRDLLPNRLRNQKLEDLRQRFNWQIRLARSSNMFFYFILGLAVWSPEWLNALPKSVVPSSIQNGNLVAPQGLQLTAPEFATHAPARPHKLSSHAKRAEGKPK